MSYQVKPGEGNVCWFCTRRQVEPGAALTTILYGTGGGPQHPVIIPRCPSCRRAHKLHNITSYFLIAVALGLSIVFAVLAAAGNVAVGVGVFLISVLVLVFISYRLQLMLERGTGIRGFRNVDDHPEVSEIMKLTGCQYMKFRD